METLSLTRFKANMTAALSMVDSGHDVILKSKKHLYKIVPVEDVDNVVPLDVQKDIDVARNEYRKGICKTCGDLDELHSFLDSL